MDRRLLERARQGDPAGYGALVREHQDIAFRMAYLVVGDAAEAEDVAQEAFIKAFRSLDRFQPDAAFRPWLLKIVTNEALNRQRTNRRRIRLERRAALESPARLADSPEQAYQRLEQRASLDDTLANLGDADRLILTYRYFLDLPVSEMAQILECAESTVRTRISRALARLRKQMTENVEESHHG